MRDECGSGAVLALAVLGASVVVTLSVLAGGAAVVVRQRTIGAADAAAIAAADTASGALAGDPCPTAARVAQANRAVLSGCRIDGLIASVHVTSWFGVVAVEARSTAGPPP